MAAEGGAPEAVPREPSRRLFFALWPDEAMRQALAHETRQAARVSGGRPVPEAHLHVTLAFLGSVPERRLPQLAEAARGTAEPARFASPAGSPAESLELTFERLEYWPAAQLLCALPSAPPAEVAALARKLRDALLGSGFSPDLKRFRPHVTVARKVARATAGGELHPVVWRFSELALVESRTLPQGALYSVVGTYPLYSRPPSPAAI